METFKVSFYSHLVASGREKTVLPHLAKAADAAPWV